MIKVRLDYLRTRGHRFWTRAFSINKKSVPGFLSDLTDTILQCGKAVALLRICDPKVSRATFLPLSVRVSALRHLGG